MKEETGYPPVHHAPERDPVWRLIPRLDGTSSKVVTVFDSDGVIRYQSRPICHLLGLQAHSCIGRRLQDLLKEESREAAAEALREMAEENVPRKKWRFCFKSASGNNCWLVGKAVNFLKDPRLGGIVVYWEPASQEAAGLASSR